MPPRDRGRGPPETRKRRPGQEAANLEGQGDGGRITRTGPAAQARSRLRRQRLVERICDLGPRVVFELLDELATRHPGLDADLDRRLARFAGLDPVVLAAVGGNRFPAGPLRAVGDRR